MARIRMLPSEEIYVYLVRHTNLLAQFLAEACDGQKNDEANLAKRLLGVIEDQRVSIRRKFPN